MKRIQLIVAEYYTNIEIVSLVFVIPKRVQSVILFVVPICMFLLILSQFL